MALIVVSLMFLFASVLAISNPKRALGVCVFFTPWSGLDVDLGLRVTAYLVFFVPLSIIMTFRLLTANSAAKVRLSLGVFWFVLAYAIIWSVVQIPFLPEVDIRGGWLRSPEIRAVSQIVMFLITIAPIFVVPMVIRHLEDVSWMAKIYIISAVVLAIIGWLQMVIWISIGSDPFPVGFVNQLLGGMGSIRSGQFEFGGDVIYRMSSFGGEPRDLGAGLVVALLLLQSGIKVKGMWGKFLWPFLLVSMIATFSTMSIMSWVAASLIQYVVSKNFRFGLPKVSMKLSKSTLLTLMLVFLPIIAMFSFAPESRFVRMIEMRTIDRIVLQDENTNSLENTGVLEDFNVAVLGFLLANPYVAITGVGLGDVHLYADSYLPDYAVSYAGGTPFVAKSSILRWTSELGVVSLSVFLFWGYLKLHTAVSLLYRNNATRKYGQIIAKFTPPILAFWLVSSYIVPQFFITAGVIVTLGMLARDIP